MRLAGKVAIISGGSRGMGAYEAELFVREGAKVVVGDVLEDEGRNLAEKIGEDAFFLRLDVTSEADWAAAVKLAVDRYGKLDVLVNNAGWDVIKPFLDTDPDLWKKVIDINLYGPLNMHHAVLPGMVKNGGGRVVNIASDAGRVGSSGEAVYSACKGGIISFTKTVARELARKGIQLNAVAPGPTDTPLFAQVAEGEAGQKIAEGLKRAIPMKRLAQPTDYPGIICFLSSDDAGFITGQVISVSGGLSMHG